MGVKFLKSKIQPNPKEVTYWVDIDADPYGSVIKIWNGYNWVPIAGAASAGTGDYNDLTNKPSIEGVTLQGNVTLKDLGALTSDDVEPIIDAKYIDETELNVAITEAVSNIEGDGAGYWNN